MTVYSRQVYSSRKNKAKVFPLLVAKKVSGLTHFTPQMLRAAVSS
jgi:hypothetical protein